MIVERPTPRMQDQGKTELGLQLLVAKREERRRGRSKEQAVARRLIVLDERVQAMRQREDQVEVRHGQQGRALVREPRVALGALAGGAVAIAARMRDEARFFALAALIQMATEHGRAARLDGAQRAPVLWRQSVRARVVG